MSLGLVPVTSSFRTSRRWGSRSSPSSIRFFVPSRSVRAVATTGRFVVWSRRRVSCRPMPREAGEVKIQGCTIVRGRMKEQSPLAKGNCSGKGGREPCRRSYGMTYFVWIDRAEEARRHGDRGDLRASFKTAIRFSLIGSLSLAASTPQ